MASKLVKYGFCQCWQHPGCCCCCLDLCKHTRCGGDCLVVVNHLPCCICLRLAVEEHVLIVGLKGAGKTTLLYYLMLHQLIKNAKPTKGFNNELVSFNRWQTYEFYDLGGSAVQRKLWKKYYESVHFSYVIWVVDGQKWRRSDAKQRDVVLLQDRMELHALLSEEDLDPKDTKFIVFVNFAPRVPNDAARVVEEIHDDLELTRWPEIPVIGDFGELKDELKIEDDPAFNKTCLCPS